METLAVRNPVALHAIHEAPLAPRPTSLKGQTLGLWWNLKEGGNTALEHIGAALERRFAVKLYKAYPAYPGAGVPITRPVDKWM